MRIAIGCIMQETNSFCPIKTDIDDFKYSPLLPLLEGQSIIEAHRGKESEIGGFISVCDANSVEIIPTLASFAMSSGNVTAGAFSWLLDMLLTKLRRAGHLDGVLLALHGSMIVDGLEDPEGEILSQVRDLVGPKVRVGCSLDLHADVTKRMVETADIIVGYETHTDYASTGARAAGPLLDCIKKGIKPHVFLRKLPAVMGARQGVLDAKRKMEQQAGVLTASVFDANPWTDISEHGPSAVVITEASEELGDSLCKELADLFWETRHQAIREQVPISDAVAHVQSGGEKPVVLVEMGDLIGAGAVGDSVFILKALFDAGVVNLVAVIFDPAAVEQAFSAGKGASVSLDIGGHLAYAGAVPLPFGGTVRKLYDGLFTLQGLPFAGISACLGRTAVIGRGDTDIVVTSKRIHPQGGALFDTIGLDVSHKRAIVLKSGAEGLTFAIDRSISIKTPGLANWDFRTVPYKNLKRPMSPLDTM